MRITATLSDEQILAELGARIARTRLARNMTQADLAQASGVGKRTLERLEAGYGMHCISLVRILRALSLLRGCDGLIPENAWGLPERALVRGHRRMRATRTGDATEPYQPSRGGIAIDIVHGLEDEQMLSGDREHPGVTHRIDN